MLDITSEKFGGSGAVIVVIVVLLCLVGFLGKAFHIDDPLFLWTAKHIQQSPGNFYGFDVNWYGTEMPMHEVTKNPPITSYYIALVGSVFGYGEIALHLAFLIPAVGAALGTYYLAKEFCVQPVIAALAAVLTPGFLVSSSNVMCDTMMLAFWVWAMFLWVVGIKRGKNLSLLFSALLIAMCALTKYFGMCLIPLLVVYSLVEKRKLGMWVLFLLLPVAILAGYQFLTQALYGKGLLLDAASYATHEKWVGRADFLTKGLTGLAFTGGCVITGLFFMPLLWSKRALIVWVLLAAALVFALSFIAKIGRFSVRSDDRVEWLFLLQLGLMVLGAISIITVSCVDLYRHRSAESLLLFLWLIGTFVFVSFINWTINARSILPMVPAVGILLMRRIADRDKAAGKASGGWKISLPLVPAAIVAMLVCGGDYVWASSIRGAASPI